MNFERNLDPKRSMEIGQIATRIKVCYAHDKKYPFEMSYKAWEFVKEFNRLSRMTMKIIAKEGFVLQGKSAILHQEIDEKKKKIFGRILEEGGNKHWVRNTLLKVKI